MPYTIHPLISPSAFPTLSDIFVAAFADHPAISLLYPHTPPDIKREFDVKRYEESWSQREKDGSRWFVVRHSEEDKDAEEGNIVAWARWQVPHEIVKEEKKAGEQGETKQPEGANVDLINEVWTRLLEGRAKWIGPKEYFLNTLAVHPSHQRKGLGSMLIKVGLDMADRDGARTYIEASSKGLPLYLRHGWEPVGATTIDTRKFGGTEVMVDKTLMREPGGLRK